MHSHLIAVGKRTPAWVTAAFNDYNRRLPREFRLNLVEITPAVRSSSTTIVKVLAEEGKRIHNTVPRGAVVIALDKHGDQYDSKALSRKIAAWQGRGHDLVFIIGGADGLNHELKNSADTLWSLSRATLPHTLARIIVVEQIYRAWTILQKHPYHRE